MTQDKVGGCDKSIIKNLPRNSDVVIELDDGEQFFASFFFYKKNYIVFESKIFKNCDQKYCKICQFSI